MKKQLYKRTLTGILVIVLAIPMLAYAQTDQDALMMGHRNLCVAGMGGYNSWTNYWEGTFKRDNANIGRMSTTYGMLMLNYGIVRNVNILASLPYVSTKASRGTLSGMNGLQDLAFYLKWRPLRKQVGKQMISVFGVGSFSTPSNDYNIDLQPVSIGLGGKVLSARLIFDIQRNKFFSTVSAGYMHRGNVEIDRPAYYTDRQIYSHEVQMPDAGNFQLRTGYRSKKLIAEAFLVNTTTFGGFDIRKNDMPFVSNKMNSNTAGLEAKYYLNAALGINAVVAHTLNGRNVGQATGYSAGILYTIRFKSNASQTVVP
jgi:hypothetical protein